RGTIEIDGSSTVAPITEAVAEEFRSVAPDVLVNVGISGSGGGFKQFTVGETDISDASRPIKENEAATAAENGVEYYEFLVGLDGLSVMVNPQNDFVDCMTVDQLNMLWKPESTITKWSDLDSSWPDRKINLYGPGTDSGTFDYFTEEVNGEAKLSRADYTASEDDNVLVQGISGDRNALGYFGFAYYAVSADKLKLLDIDNGNGCVAPTIETIASGTYSPLSRPLFIYVNKERAQQRAELRSFVEFYMENGAQLAEEVGYVPLPQASYQQNLAVLSGQQVMMEAGPKVALSGTIEIDGSSTVAPITEAVAEEFRKEQPGVLVKVGISGSGGGFKRFMVGETDVSDASRAIKSSEAATAAENGISYFEFLVGVDGLSVMVNPDNDFVNCLMIEQLNMLWKPESTISKWSDIDSSWPDRDINLYGPGTDSGTFDYFTEEVNGEAKLSRADYTASEDDNVLVQGISGDRNALGYFGFAYYAVSADKLKLLDIDNGNGCVAPTIETIASGTYSPLSRPLFIYVNKERAQQRAELRSFVEFYMENGAQLAEEVGYVPLPQASYQQNLAVLSGQQVMMEAGPKVALSGTIEIDGSSTVAPITEAVAEEFRKEQPGVLVNVGISGSGGGFKRFMVGETDVSDASRAIKSSEAATAAENSISYFEFLVGVDGLSVMVNPDNDFVNCLMLEQLNMLWKPESTISKWSDLDSSWPDRDINLYGPGTDSGTFDYFTEE
ncbi:Protein SphX, partial [Geodia barretti]